MTGGDWGWGLPGGVPWSRANALIAHHGRQSHRVEGHLGVEGMSEGRGGRRVRGGWDGIWEGGDSGRQSHRVEGHLGGEGMSE